MYKREEAVEIVNSHWGFQWVLEKDQHLTGVALVCADVFGTTLKMQVDLFDLKEYAFGCFSPSKEFIYLLRKGK